MINCVILVVEDNPVNMRLVRLILRTQGYTVCEATTGSEALHLLHRERPHLILLDMQLPGMDGFTLAAKLKADPRTAAIPLVAVTALAMKGDGERVLASGCDAYLPKPIDDKELIEVIERCLNPKP
ncbi:MAG TPA: response regulator [Chloroflexota bacterium]|nr:response regulator [Chloroflexota bacterium]